MEEALRVLSDSDVFPIGLTVDEVDQLFILAFVERHHQEVLIKLIVAVRSDVLTVRLLP